MALAPLPEVTVTPVAHLPKKYFLENLVVRADGSVLITALLSKELWLVAAPARELCEPVLLHRFGHLTTGIVEVEPDVFVVSLSELYTTHESHLVRIDLNGWTPGTPVNPEIIYTFDERVRALNGSCAFGPSSMLLADCFAGLIWRVDLFDHAHKATADVWVSHDTMWHDPDSEVPPPLQPGVNGVRYGAKTGYVYYTSTAQKVFMRVRVDSKTLDPASPRSSSPRSTTPTTSASTRTPASPTSPATAATPSTAFRLPRATAARCGTSPATRSTR